MANWIQPMVAKMKQKGSEGSFFGKATDKKIAAGKAEGGVQKKKAVVAETFKNMAAKRKSGY